MRKQNSKFQTSFISEEGSELKNSDYFAFIELDNFACYVLADGIEDLADCESAREAVESIISRFQEKPSLSKRAMSGYLKYANEALLNARKYMKLKASVALIVTDYETIRFAYAGNTRIKIYRNNKTLVKSTDTSLSSDLVERSMLSEDALARHEERNNLYAYLGQKSFKPQISNKLKLLDTDILLMYSKGIWENISEPELDEIFSDSGKNGAETLERVEKAILDKHPKYIDNYSIVSIYADKIFVETDPARRKRRRIIIIAVLVSAILLIIALTAVYFYTRFRRETKEDMNTHFDKMLRFIENDNYKKADIECAESIKRAERLRDKEMKELLYHYEQVIDGILEADEEYGADHYVEAKEAYKLILDEVPYADNAGLSYIEKRLAFISGYESVNLSMENGDILFDAGIYDKARERYVEAKTEARRIGYEEGKVKAEAKLVLTDQEISKVEEGIKSEVEEKTKQLMSANDMLSAGDEALKNGDYLTARANYSTARDILEKSGESAGLEALNEKIAAADGKISESDNEKNTAAEYSLKGDEALIRGELEGARENYEYARRLYVKLNDEINTIEMDKKISDVQNKLDKKKSEETVLKTGRESVAAEQSTSAETQSRGVESEEREEIGPGVSK